jgi:hypothetical protein
LKGSFCPAFSCVREYVSRATNDGIYLLSNNGRPSRTLGDETCDLVSDLWLSRKCNRRDNATGRTNDVTYYRVEFLPATPALRPAKRFRTEEKAKRHARRVLGLADDSSLASRVAIVAVARDGLTSEQALPG